MNMEFNKIFAAFLVAGIVAMLAGFISKQLVHPTVPEERAYTVEIPEGGVTTAAATAPTGPEDIEPFMAAADPANGEKLSRACMACHSFDKGGANKIGPNLWGIMGADIAHLDGFAYSSAVKEHGGTWTIANMNKWLWNPRKMIPGTKMVYPGMKKPEDRADMIAWLKTLK